jgi:hypothetical protein
MMGHSTAQGLSVQLPLCAALAAALHDNAELKLCVDKSTLWALRHLNATAAVGWKLNVCCLLPSSAARLGSSMVGVTFFTTNSCTAAAATSAEQNYQHI